MTEQTGDFIPIGEPDLSQTEVSAVAELISRGWLTRGPECQAFEEEFRALVEGDYLLFVSSCTAALHLALLVHGIGPGSEVILPSLTFAATGHSVVQCGALPVFAEVDPETYCLDPSHVESLIGPDTRALIAVHYGGHPADLVCLRELAKKNGLALIEDAAHAIGAATAEGPVGRSGSTACFSFYSNKNLTTSEGGMLTLPEKGMLERATRLSLHGIDKDAWRRFGKQSSFRYAVTEFGYKYNATDLMAALGRAQLSRFGEMQSSREDAWRGYNERFAGESRITLPPEQPDITHARHLYVIRLTDRGGTRRDEFVQNLRSRGIGATVHYDPLHLHPAYRDRFGTKEGMLPITEDIADSLVSLPLHSRLTDEQVARVTGEVIGLLGKT